ncbi:MAG: hypothetical protein KC912_04760 [Proteobacteria bacterium]|nr:hypothetical protein [Pseudomonadota bacterium]
MRLAGAVVLLAAIPACGRPVAKATPAKVFPACTGFSPGETDGKLRDHQLTEVSGLVMGLGGRRWVHNDSGDYARVFGLDATGATEVVLMLRDVDATDWEDIARSGESLLLGDIGDNLARRDHVVVHRVAEPAESGKVTSTPFVLRYPEGARNAEVLLADPRSDELLVITKEDDGRSQIFRTALPEAPTELVLEPAGWIQFPVESRGTEKSTAGDVRADGSRIVIRTYTDAWIWERGDTTLAEALTKTPCRMPLQSEPQGESIAWDGSDLLTVSEGAGRPFWRYRAE